ncbi:MAG: ABC transporter substrate-binding protein [Clostridia bacterium]|nr:ABC transporter substrate-binding protein [Clostridia bacterium]
MKKLLSLFLATVTALTLTVSATACGGASDDNVVNVGILQVATHSALDDARLGFKEVVDAWAKENGKTVKYKEENAVGDSNNERTLANLLVSERHDLLLGIATSSARALANATSSIPVLFTAVTAPEEEGLISNNVTGTSDLNPVVEQVALIKDVVPGITKIGFLYNSSENNSVIQYNLAKAKESELGIELVNYTAHSVSDINTVVRGIVSDGIQAVYVPTDNLMAENMITICSILHEAGIPVIGGEEGVCENGEAVATLGISYFELGKQTGAMAVAILSGEKTAKDISFEYYNKQPSFFINEENAAAAGLSENLIASLKAKYNV